MPSDERVGRAMDALAGAREAFRSAMAITVEEVRTLAASLRSPAADRATRMAEELGAFAEGRIDPGRLAGLLVEPHPVARFDLVQVDDALSALRSILDRGDDAFRIAVEPETSPAHAVDLALGDLGRAFGAARVVEAVRRGHHDPRERQLLERFPFRRWNRPERALVPPLVVEVDGADLRAGGLAEFLDGSLQLVLVVGGDSAPAPLVRLITPGVLVMQTDDPDDLAVLAGWPGPAVAALVSGTAARFVHEPQRDGEPARTRVVRVPDDEPRRMLGGLTPFQQREELRQLARLAAADTAGGPSPATGTAAASADGAGGAEGAVAAPPAGGVVSPAGATVAAGAAPADEAGRLAAWLLDQADLSALEVETGGET